MKTVIRFDQGSLRKPEMTSQGFLKVEGLAARAGILTYHNPDGTVRRELRLREDVASTLAGYEGASLTDGHPTVLVDSSNVRTLEAGTVMSARMDGDWVVVPIVIKDAKLIDKVKAGKTGLSAGYTVKLDETPGVHPQYGRYDAIQREITINHLAAAVEIPRAGDAARIRLDDMGGMDFAMEEPPELVVMTTIEDGHQHTLEPGDTAGCTSRAISEGATEDHKHEWIRLADGSIQISENAGHSHTVDNSTLGVRSDAVLTAKAEGNLAGHEFAVPASRQLPIHDAAHVRAAMSRFSQTHFPDAASKRSARDKIVAAAKKFGIDSSGFELAHRNDDSQIDRSTGSGERSHTQGDSMDKDEQIRLLQTQLGEATKRADKAEADLKVRTDERDTATNKLTVAEKQAEDAKTRLDSGLAVAETERVKEVQVKLDEANAKIRELESSVPEQVRKRASLVTRARAILGDDYRADALDDRTILEAGVRRFDPKADLTKESIVGLQARFDAWYESRAATAASTNRIGPAIAARTDTQAVEFDPFDPLHNGAGQYASPHAAKRGA